MIFIDSSGNSHTLPPDKEISWRVAVYGIVLSSDKKKVLMMMPAHNPKWQFPGGGVDIDETFNQALKREFIEESGYMIHSEKLIPYYHNESLFYHEGIDQYFHSVQLTFIVSLEDDRQNPDLIHEQDINGTVDWKDIGSLSKDDVQYTHWPIIQLLQKN